MNTSPPTQRPLRADARRNRDAMLAAARRVFAEQGLDAPLDAVTREAGVSRATQHRHFPTRESLIAAIFDDNLEELARIAAETPDPADAYVETLLATVEMLARDRGFVDLFNHRNIADDIKEQIAARFLTILAGPLAAAQAEGRIRADLEIDDTILLVDMLGAAVSLTGPARPEQRAGRATTLLLEAIGPPGNRQPLDADPAARPDTQ
jgi:AcrR family transcriptional regulator